MALAQKQENSLYLQGTLLTLPKHTQTHALHKLERLHHVNLPERLHEDVFCFQGLPSLMWPVLKRE